MEQKIARVHSFESFGAVDGPGIRFIVFMQGCSLKCKYCQNRDTWNLNGGMEYTSDELVSKVSRYKNYFSVSGGGVTVSGGEPLLQMPFLIEFFTKLKALGIHTAIDTSGSFSITDDMKKLIDLTDLFLLDIKCINDEICKDLTGISNQRELEFARYISKNGKDMWIRGVDQLVEHTNVPEIKAFVALHNAPDFPEPVQILLRIVHIEDIRCPEHT